MKKLVMPFEGSNYRPELLDFVRQLNDRSKILLTAAFVPVVDYSGLRTNSGGIGDAAYFAPDPAEDKMVAFNRDRITRFCEEHDIICRVHEDRFDFATGAIRQETRFADLLLMSSSHFFETIDKNQPNAYMKEILHQAECPVILVPDEPKLPGELILAYDGSSSSAYAIRQFAYLFPEFARLRATLVCISDREDARIPSEGFIREFCEQHFKNFRILQLRMRTDQFYDTWIGMINNPWLISGAFGRSDWSQLFRHSFISRLIQAHRVPLFVAHR